MTTDFFASGVPVTLNLHLTARCNYDCTFCFATFTDVPGTLDKHDQLRLIDAVTRGRVLLGRFVVDKLTFAGGEPTLLRHLPELIRAAKDAGFTTCVVTNGTGVNDEFLAAAGHWLDWVTLSLDSADETVNAAMGRGRGKHVAGVLRAVARIRKHGGPRVRMNTVVTATTWSEDLSGVVRAVAPERWKILQATRVEGQNDRAGTLLDLTPDQFASFVERHRALNPVVEDADAIRGGYLMVDPLGRAFSNAPGRLIYGSPVLKVGLETSAREVGWDPDKFLERGGVWDWRAGDRGTANGDLLPRRNGGMAP